MSEEKNEISLSVLKEIISKGTSKDREVVLMILEKLGIDLYSKFDSLTGTKVIGFTLEGETFKIDGHHHRDVYRKILFLH